MAKTHPHITDDIRDFIQHQKLFFVASAPLSADGHVNLSPKGHDCLRVLSSTQVAYLDRTGSGNETSAHVLENGRITLMWCAFDGPPNILRLYGRGRIVLPTDAEWATLAAQVVVPAGARQFVVVDVERVQTSCGFGVPLYDYVEERPQMDAWADRKGPEGLVAYRQEKNLCSIDGLPTHLARVAPDA